MKRMKRVISMLLAVVMFIAACPVSAFATTTDIAEEGKIETSSYNDYLYTLLSDGTISICGYTGSSESEQEGLYLEIPSSIDGMAVTQIAEEAFAYNEGIDTVVIPESITVVGNSAFYHCSDLKAIVFYGTAPTFGFTAVEGSSSLEKIFTLNISDISAFCALLVNDLGEDHAKGVEIAEYESLDSLKKAYSEYIAAFDANIQTASGGDETVTMPGEEETLATAASEEETLDTAASEEETLDTAASEEETLDTAASEEETLDTAVIEEETSATAANEDETQVTATPEETENTDSVLGNEDMPVTLDNTVDEAANTLVGILAEGICGDSLTWVLDVNGILTISGTGEMTNYSSGTAPWHSYSDKIKSLILSDGITSIGQYAFYNCTTLTGDLVIPDSVTSIGETVRKLG